MVFHLSLSDSISLEDFRIHLSIMADFNNAVVWICLCSSSDFQLSETLFQAFQ